MILRFLKEATVISGGKTAYLEGIVVAIPEDRQDAERLEKYVAERHAKGEGL